MARRPQLISFPHPVVGIGDDLAGVLRCNAPQFDFGVDLTTLSIDGFEVTNPTIAELVQRKDAAFTVRIGCGATYYRKSLQTHDARLQRILPSTRLCGDVELQVRVCSLKRIEGYRPVGLHEDYGDRAFTVQAGDVLAIGDEFVVRADKQFDPLAADMPSIMRIEKGPFEKGPYKVNFYGKQISIQLSVEDRARYGSVSAIAPGVIHAAIVLPVLCEAIAHVRNRNAQDGMNDLQWFKRLEVMLEARHIDENESLVVAAQKLLDLPLVRAFDNILKGREDD